MMATVWSGDDIGTRKKMMARVIDIRMAPGLLLMLINLRKKSEKGQLVL